MIHLFCADDENKKCLAFVFSSLLSISREAPHLEGVRAPVPARRHAGLLLVRVPAEQTVAEAAQTDDEGHGEPQPRGEGPCQHAEGAHVDQGGGRAGREDEEKRLGEEDPERDHPKGETL